MRREVPGVDRSSLARVQALALLVGAHAAAPPRPPSRLPVPRRRLARRERARPATELYRSDTWQYEPELFPGLIYRMVSPKVVLLIFVSGKLVITGAKNRDNIYNSFGNILPVLQKFRKAS